MARHYLNGRLRTAKRFLLLRNDIRTSVKKSSPFLLKAFDFRVVISLAIRFIFLFTSLLFFFFFFF